MVRRRLRGAASEGRKVRDVQLRGPGRHGSVCWRGRCSGSSPGTRSPWAGSEVAFAPKCGNAVRIDLRLGPRAATLLIDGSGETDSRKPGEAALEGADEALISCAGYAREQAQSSPPNRVLLSRAGAPARPLAPRGLASARRPSPLGDIASDALATVQSAASLPSCGVGACPAPLSDRALREPALRVDPGSPQLARPLPIPTCPNAGTPSEFGGVGRLWESGSLGGSLGLTV